MSDILQEIRDQLEHKANARIYGYLATKPVGWLGQQLAEIKKRINEISEAGPTYRNEINLLFAAIRGEYLEQRLAEVKKRINEIPEADPRYRYELNLLYKERDVIYEMIAESNGGRRSQYTPDMPDHEGRLVAKIEAQQAERVARKAELANKIDAFKSKIQNNTKRSIENFNDGVKNVIHIFGFQRRAPQKLGYEK